MLFFFAQAWAQDPAMETPGTGGWGSTMKSSRTEGLPPFIVEIEAEEEVPTFTEAELWDRGLAIHFPQSKITVRPGDKGIEKLERACRRLAAEGYYICRVLVVRGSASPEGTQQFNELLSRLRGEVIAQKIIDWGLGASDSTRAEDILLTTQAVEDYYGLRRLMERTSWAYAPRVIKAIDEGGGNMRKTKQLLRSLDGGYIWMRLNKLFFPELRTSRVVIVVSRPPVEKENLENSEKLAVIEPPVLDDTIAEPEPELEPEPEQPRKLIFALHTNLLIPGMNFGFEVPIGEHWSIGGDYYYPWAWRKSDMKDCFQLTFFSAEARYWIGRHSERSETSETSRNRLLGHSVGVYAAWGYYDFERNFTGHQGDIWSAGLDYVYALPLRKTRTDSAWRLEFQLAFGFIHSKAHPYDVFEEGGHLINRRNVHKNFNYFGPTKAGISLVIPVTRATKKGGER